VPKKQSGPRGGKHIVSGVGHTWRYEPLPSELRAITALVLLRNKTSVDGFGVEPAAGSVQGAGGGEERFFYHNLRFAMHRVFHELGVAA
jgi:hypothetical protein